MPWVSESTHSMILAIESTHSTSQPVMCTFNASLIECTHLIFFLFIWRFMSLLTLYRSYHNG